MAKANTARFSEFLIEMGDDASPQAFSAPCGALSRGFKRTAAMAETNVPDCDDPDAASWLERDVTSKSATCDFSGVVDKDDFQDWDDFWELEESRDIKITLGSIIWQGQFKLSDLEVTGEKGNRITFTATIQSDGPVVRTSP